MPDACELGLATVRSQGTQLTRRTAASMPQIVDEVVATTPIDEQVRT